MRVPLMRPIRVFWIGKLDTNRSNPSSSPRRSILKILIRLHPWRRTLRMIQSRLCRVDRRTLWYSNTIPETYYLYNYIGCCRSGTFCFGDQNTETMDHDSDSDYDPFNWVHNMRMVVGETAWEMCKGKFALEVSKTVVFQIREIHMTTQKNETEIITIESSRSRPR